MLYIKVFLLLLALCEVGRAQLIDPYRRVTDPRAIADLTGDDTEPLRYRARHGLPPELDEHGHHILAQDSGAGIITHIWSTADLVDSTTELRLYIDGALILSSTFSEFFLKTRGAFRPPLDTALAGGWVNDVQMPYRDGFKITYKSPSYNLYTAIAWRRVKDKTRLRSFRLYPTVAESVPQIAAEKRMASSDSPWDKADQDSIVMIVSLPTDTSVTIAELDGPAMIQELTFLPERKDPWQFHNLFLRIYFDGSPYPAVDVPLFDFFMSATRYKPINALSIKVGKDSVMRCYLPMPFHRSAKVMLVNRDTATATIAASVKYSAEPIDRDRYGYFHARFHESKPTRLGIFHPVLHVRGKGRFVGLGHHIPKLFFAVDLEGDPVITVDSNKDHFIRYTGGEDYYNGGWWFLGTTYSRPFAGFHSWFDGFYRFHYLDAIDFKQSLNFNMQHGVNNDVHDHYRTIAYYYKEWTPFWTDRDTVRFGEPLTVSGAGYEPGEKLLIKLDSVALGLVDADQNGSFSRMVYMPVAFSPGKYQLSVNGKIRPEWTFLIDKPSVRAIADHDIPILRERDTLLVTGTGFLAGEKVRIYLDSIPLNGEFEAGSNFRFTGMVRMPYLPDRDYHLVAIGEKSGLVVAQYPVRMTRVQNFEFETHLPPLEKTAEVARRDNVSFFYRSKWSQQSIAYFEAAGRDSFITFAIDVPRSDTFKVFLFATIGPKFGDFEYYIDGERKGEFSGYHFPPHEPKRSDTLHAGIIYLEEGIHTVTFKCTGKHDSSGLYWLGADNIILAPIHPLPTAPGTWLEATPDPELVQRAQLHVYPNPADKSVSLLTPLSPSDSDVLSGPAVLSIVDVSGRAVLKKAVDVRDILYTSLSVDISTLSNGKYFLKLDCIGITRSVSLSAPLSISR